jgi:predicted Zn-dependent protease
VNVAARLDNSELAFILCHELAHHVAGVTEKHSERWRRECVLLVEEAGELGLLSHVRVKQATEMVLHGAASKFRGWPAQARKLKQKREDRREAEREAAVSAGVKPGALVFFRYRDSLWRGEVIRINQTTVSVGEIGGDRTILRVPFARLLEVKPKST